MTTQTIVSYSKPVDFVVDKDEVEVIRDLRAVCENEGYGSVEVTVTAGTITYIRRFHGRQINGRRINGGGI